MKRTALLLFLLIPVATALRAQLVLTGRVVNAQNKEPVEFATARLFLAGDTTLAGGANTDEKGGFALRARSAGTYTLRVSCISYEPVTRKVVVEAGQDTVRLGDIALKSTDIALRSAIVTGTAARVEQKEDTTVFNASAYRVPEGSTLEALVKQLPGVEVADDGTIKWNGKTVTEFLINGKDFFKGETKTAMKNLPVELVSKIKAYDKQSDYTEQTGIDDGEETTVLDIATKREFNESWIANADLAYGTRDRYSGRIFASRFTDRSRVTAYGSANNTNDRGFGGPRGQGGGGGLTASKNAGLDFTWENGKKKREAGRLELGGNVQYAHTGTDLVSTSASETFLTSGATSSFSNSHSSSGTSSTNVNARLRLSWTPDSMTTLMFRPAFTHSESRNAGYSRTGTFSGDPYEVDGMYSPLDSIFSAAMSENLNGIAVNRTQRQTLGDSRSNSFTGSLTMTRRLNSKGRNVSLRANAGYTDSESRSFSIPNIKYFKAQPGKEDDYLNQYTFTPSRNWNYNLRLGYAEPFAKNWVAELRYEYAYKYSDSDRSLYDLDDIDPAVGSWGDGLNHPAIGVLPTEADVLAAVRDDNNSRYATYRYQDHTATVGVRYNSEKIRFNAGLGVNPQRTEMEYQRPGQHIDTVVTRTVFKFSPQVRLRYRFSKTNQLDLRYQGSSSQPSMTDLLEVVDDSDPLSVSMGNPGLKPAWTNRFRANYNGYNPDRQQGIMGGVDISQTSNSISNLMVYDEASGIRYTHPENINGNWNARGHFMFNTGLGALKTFTISTFTTLGYDNSVGYVSVYDRGGASAVKALGTRQATVPRTTFADYAGIFDQAQADKNTTRTLTVGENLNASYRASWFDVGLLGTLNYQHARSRLQENANMDTWNFSYGANANFTFDWGMSVSTDLRMSSRRGFSDASMNTNELLWNAQIAQSFLKGRAATISLQFYDILHQQSSVSRTINAQLRSDSWSNAIHSYCMLHFIYKLNIFPGGKGSGDGDEGPRERMRGPGGGYGPGGRMGPPMGGGGFGGR